ncbi:hypothetical protein, partial [Acidiferrobacter sp.]|uniref:hypothetical protein n=1 Tax=Acidiferrobacter sp. TaxID=1872107 RepID=UPI002603F2E2
MNPDTVHFRLAKKLEEKIRRHTVQLHFFRGETKERERRGSGSGTLVKLKDRYFILSAGHCVDDAGSPDLDEIAVLITTSPHEFKPKLIRRARYPDVDVGFFEVPCTDASTIEAKDRVFLSEGSISIMSAEDLKARNDWMCIGGYPGVLMEQKTDTGAGSRLLVYSTIIAGTGETPKPTEAPERRCGMLDLWVPPSGNVLTTEHTNQPVAIPTLSGASGGGCWLLRVRPHKVNWSADDISLVGTHVGSWEETVSGEKHLFGREILLSWHLVLIAKECPELKGVI